MYNKHQKYQYSIVYLILRFPHRWWHFKLSNIGTFLGVQLCIISWTQNRWSCSITNVELNGTDNNVKKPGRGGNSYAAQQQSQQNYELLEWHNSFGFRCHCAYTLDKISTGLQPLAFQQNINHLLFELVYMLNKTALKVFD